MLNSTNSKSEQNHKGSYAPVSLLPDKSAIKSYQNGGSNIYKINTDDDAINLMEASNGQIKHHHAVGTGAHKKKLGLAALVVLIYYGVSGGPFGIEDIVRAGGPFYAIIGFSLFLVWAIPEALITAELSTAMPEASGAVGKYKFVINLD